MWGSYLIVCILLGTIVLKIYLKLSAGRCKSNVCLIGKTAIVTGGNSGIGFQTVLALASRGCRVIIVDKVDAEESKKKAIELTHNDKIVVKFVDLESFESIRAFAKNICSTEERLDILVNNAGVGSGGNVYSEDGLHLGMQINHFGPFLLTHCLIDFLKKTELSRVIFISSWLAFTNNLTLDNLNYPQKSNPTFWDHLMVYSNSKLCNIISTLLFAEKLKQYGITVNALHPGLVKTSIFSTFFKTIHVGNFGNVLFYSIFLNLFGKTAEEGAQTAIYLCASNKVKNVTGTFFVDCGKGKMPRAVYNKQFCEDVWRASEKYVKLEEHEKLLGNL